MPIPFSIKIIKKLDEYLFEQMERLNQNSTDFCYREKTSQEIEEHQDKFCSADEIMYWVLAMEDEQIIGRLAVFKREIVLEGKQVTLGGIGKVKVRDVKRRQGVATRLLQEAMPLFKQTNCDLVYLCTNINNPILVRFYGKYGFNILCLNVLIWVSLASSILSLGQCLRQLIKKFLSGFSITLSHFLLVVETGRMVPL